MKNLFLNDIKDFKSPEAKTFYKDVLALGYSEEAVLRHNLRESSKDASRGAMQWNQSALRAFQRLRLGAASMSKRGIT